ncbi:CDP-glucose 4,6-dehydratase [Rhodoferax antarcticus]|nr:CDP-glucose 4,6-dehydratase [Rhodoferax antarcticus]APW45621.1 CDP-glucose 4,6-dehydratase [Rhodoferax antarcticus]
MEGVVMHPNASFWRGKRVLLTGHTGFKGGWLALWLQRLGAEVTGLALVPNTTPSLFDTARVSDGMCSRLCDIRDATAVAHLMQEAQPELVLHLAAQPLVRASYRDPLATFSTNVMGTANLLESLRGLASVRVAVMVTTDKVYRNLEHAYPYREDDALGGHDPYSASKAASELVIASYRDAFLAQQGVAIASARAGNVIGGGDWSEDRLIPDAVRAWQAGQTLSIRSRQAIRPWQHVLEPLAGYLRLAEVLWEQPELAGAYNFGPPTHEAATVEKVMKMASSPYPYCATSYQINSSHPHETAWLALETAKARSVLGVHPRWTLPQAVARTMDWYVKQHAGADARELCGVDIDSYESNE